MRRRTAAMGVVVLAAMPTVASARIKGLVGPMLPALSRGRALGAGSVRL